MKKLISTIIAATVLLLSAGIVRASTTVSESATIRKDIKIEASFDYRVINLESFLERYNSPISSYAPYFVEFADTYGIDYRLVPAITGVESTFGKHIPQGSFNAYGWANGKYKFTSWEQSIEVVTSTLRTRYIDRGALTVNSIGRRYAPPSSTWAGKVNFFIKRIDTLPVTFDL